MRLAIVYTRLMFLALPLLYFYLFVTSILLGAGDSKTPLRFIALATAVAAALNPLFMFGVGGVSGGGVAGAALANLVSQAISLAALMRYLYQGRHPLCLYRKDLPISTLDRSIVSTLL